MDNLSADDEALMLANILASSDTDASSDSDNNSSSDENNDNNKSDMKLSFVKRNKKYININVKFISKNYKTPMLLNKVFFYLYLWRQFFFYKFKRR